MFLRTILFCLVFSVFGLGANAQTPIPGLQKKTYKLKSFTKNLRGKKTETRAGRDRFCGEKINPVLRDQDGGPRLELNAGLGFEWRNIDETPAEMSDGCRYPVQQKIESAGGASILILVNGEDCGNSKPVIGSQRDTIHFKGSEITYVSESVVKDGVGGWQVNGSKEGFTCLWSVAE